MGLSHREVSGVCDLDSFCGCGLISEKVAVWAGRESWDSLCVVHADAPTHRWHVQILQSPMTSVYASTKQALNFG